MATAAHIEIPIEKVDDVLEKTNELLIRLNIPFTPEGLPVAFDAARQLCKIVDDIVRLAPTQPPTPEAQDAFACTILQSWMTIKSLFKKKPVEPVEPVEPAKPVTRKRAKPAAGAAAKRARAKPVAGPAVASSAKPVAKPAAKRARAKPAAGPAAEPVAEPVVEFVVEFAAEPAAGPAVERLASGFLVRATDPAGAVVYARTLTTDMGSRVVCRYVELKTFEIDMRTRDINPFDRCVLEGIPERPGLFVINTGEFPDESYMSLDWENCNPEPVIVADYSHSTNTITKVWEPALRERANARVCAREKVANLLGMGCVLFFETGATIGDSSARELWAWDCKKCRSLHTKVKKSMNTFQGTTRPVRFLEFNSVMEQMNFCQSCHFNYHHIIAPLAWYAFSNTEVGDEE
jgi:hypothetical protein